MPQRDYQTNTNSVPFAAAQAVGGTGAHAPEVAPSTRGAEAYAGLSNTLNQLGASIFSSAVENEYLRGQQARQAGQSWENVDSNILTRPLVRGGYQDADYQIQLAQAGADLDEFIRGAGKTLNPTEFAQEANRRTQSVLRSMGDGLTVQGRTSALRQTSDMLNSAQAAHRSAYSQYRLQQVQEGNTRLGNSIAGSLAAAQASGEHDQIAAATLRANTYFEYLQGNEDLPPDARNSMQRDFAVHLATQGQGEYVQNLMDHGKLDHMSFSDLDRIGAAVSQDQKNRTTLMQAQTSQWRAEAAQAVKDGRVGSLEQMQQLEAQAHAYGVPQSQVDSMWRDYSASASTAQDNAELLNAVQSGDVNSMIRLAGGTQQAQDQVWSKSIAPNDQMSAAEKVKFAVSAGASVGAIAAPAVKEIGAAANAVMRGGDLNPEQADMFETTMATVAAAKQANPTIMASFTSQLDNDTSKMLSYVVSAKSKQPNLSVRDAMTDYSRQQTELRNVSPAALAVDAKQTREAATQQVAEEFGSGGVINSTASWIKGQFGTATSNNPYLMGTMQQMVNEEIANLQGSQDGQRTYYNNPDMLVQDAVSAVKSRMIDVRPEGWGLTSDAETTRLFLNRGETQKTVFGTSNQDGYLGEELYRAYPPKLKGGTVSYEQHPDGSVWATQLTKDGHPANSVQVDTAKVGQAVQQREEQHQSEQYKAYRGADVSGASKIPVRVDGANTVGLDPTEVYQWRNELVKQEDVRHTAYTDTTGNVTIGVGHNVQGSMRKGDTTTPEQTQAWFREDSNKALMQGNRMAMAMGVTDTQAILGLSGMMFQMGPANVAKFKNMQEAIRNKDWDAFKQSVYDSKWYKQQTPGRAQIFMNRMRGHFLTPLRPMPSTGQE